ncbi:MAG: molybdopterin-dependent oxidoreductase [Chloroflexota bacterium]|nr:molybdopterin-dependent oxidoreductase [Chloroflexota bacterium]
MDTTSLRQDRAARFRTGFIAGLAAGAAASGVMLLLNVVFGSISLPEAFGSELTALMPAAMFDFLHQLIGGDAKHYLFYGILVGQCLVFALSGGLYNLVMERARAMFGLPATEQVEPGQEQAGSSRVLVPALHMYDGLLLASALWLLAGLVLLPLTGAGIFGAQLSAGPIDGLLSLGVVGLVFGLLFVLVQNQLTQGTQSGSETRPEAEASRREARRTLLKRGVLVVGAGLLGVAGWHFITDGLSAPVLSVTRLVKQYKNKIVPPPVPNYGEITPAPYLSPEVTPNDQYYVVSKNLFSDPSVDSNNWRLTVSGEVSQPFTLTYKQLLALPMQKQYESMMCVSNEVGGEYMSNALWEGVRLADLLQSAGVKPGATKVVFRAVDDYSDSIHLTKALEPTTLLAVHMNGATLPGGHGFPARMLVPGIYGMKHCKWITQIEVINYDYQGYWQQRGWSDAAPVRLTARIDTPLTGTAVRAGKVTFIAGVAFSGNRGISEVDVSTDGGQNWQRATLKKPLSGLTWVLWEFPWQVPAKAGSYNVAVRAIDLEGNVQDPNVAPPAPDGSSGYHSIAMTVL